MLQPDATAGHDSYIGSDATSTNYGTATTIETASLNAAKIGYIRRGLLRFDLSSLVGATVSAVTVTLYISTYYGNNFTVKRLTQTGWEEASVTWNDYKTSTPWTGAGGDYTETNAWGPFAIVGTGSRTYGSDSNLVAQAQYAIDTAPSQLMHMIMFTGSPPSEQTYGAIFYSSDYGTAGDRPKLTVTYTTGGAAPTPPFRIFRMRFPFEPPMPRQHTLMVRLDPGGQTTLYQGPGLPPIAKES